MRRFRLQAQHFVNLDAQIAWQAQHFVNLDVQISWQAQHFVSLDVQILWQAQHFVNLDVQISWQAQRCVNLDVQISWQAQDKMGCGEIAKARNALFFQWNRWLRSWQVKVCGTTVARRSRVMLGSCSGMVGIVRPLGLEFSLVS